MSTSTFFPPQHRAEALPAHLQRRVSVRAKRSREKAVTWPPEDQICQIRLFLSNDIPSSIGCAQNVMRTNLMRISPTQGILANGPLGSRSSMVKRARGISGSEAFMAVDRPWFCPQKFFCDIEWLVADGDESKEAELQQQRELRVLEAFYPRLTAIPESPAEPVEICTVLHEGLIPAIPMVPIEEEDGESSKEEEAELRPEELSGHGKPEEDCLPASKSNSLPSEELSQHGRDSCIGSTDAKVAVGMAAEAARTALRKLGATDLVDPDLLVEILKNPILLKSLALNNQSSWSSAVAMNGLKPCTNGQLIWNHHGLQFDGPPRKTCSGATFNAGLPSPVSVLSDWTQQEHAVLLPNQHLNSNDNSNASNVPNASLPPSSAPNVLHNPCASRLPVESARVHGHHPRSHEVGMGYNTSCLSNVNVPMTSVVHTNRLCDTVAPRTPFPAHGAINLHPNLPKRMQTAPGLSPKFGATHHRGMSSLDGVPCKNLHPEASFRGSEYSGPCSLLTNAGPRTARVCMYFNTPRGCRNGGNCAFLHNSGNPELNAIGH